MRARQGRERSVSHLLRSATVVAAELRSQAGRKRTPDPMTQQMIAYLGELIPLTAEEPDENFELLFTHLIYVWLTGRTMPYAEPVVAQLAAGTGLQNLADGALARLNLDEYGRGLVANVPDGVRAASLPALRRAVLTSDIVAFERARDDYPVLRDALIYVREAIASCLRSTWRSTFRGGTCRRTYSREWPCSCCSPCSA